MNTNEVIVECRFGKEIYQSTYLDDVCCAETIRNCCVNLCIDPDMSEGQILNIKVYKLEDNSYSLWKYVPSERISACSVIESDGLLHLRILLTT